MWDGYHLLANEQAWQALPKDLQEIAARNLNAAALAERNDLQTLASSVQGQLEKQGLVFNKVDPAAFRTVLKQAGFYAQWRDKYGPEAWAVLEKYSGSLV
jgi:TRAP-type C4-dicarboxylate transport system substrate-binding protein